MEIFDKDSRVSIRLPIRALISELRRILPLKKIKALKTQTGFTWQQHKVSKKKKKGVKLSRWKGTSEMIQRRQSKRSTSTVLEERAFE